MAAILPYPKAVSLKFELSSAHPSHILIKSFSLYHFKPPGQATTYTMESLHKRLLATTIDDFARKTPDERFAVIPQGSELSNGFQTLLMKDMAQAVNYMSWWIESTVGPAQNRETLAYMGCNDIRYFIFMLACQKTGYQVRKSIGFYLCERCTLTSILHRPSCLRPETPMKPMSTF